MYMTCESGFANLLLNFRLMCVSCSSSFTWHSNSLYDFSMDLWQFNLSGVNFFTQYNGAFKRILDYWIVLFIIKTDLECWR